MPIRDLRVPVEPRGQAAVRNVGRGRPHLRLEMVHYAEQHVDRTNLALASSRVSGQIAQGSQADFDI